jgi:hypothetical protein
MSNTMTPIEKITVPKQTWGALREAAAKEMEKMAAVAAPKQAK